MFNIDKKVSVSNCCKKGVVSIQPIEDNYAPGCTRYFHVKCTKCNKPCTTLVSQVFDSAGLEIGCFDIVEVPELPIEHAERFHAAYMVDYGDGLQLEIRDLGNNNCGMYDCYSQYYTRGPFWRHLDKLSDNDLLYYWNVTRHHAELLAMAEKGGV